MKRTFVCAALAGALLGVLAVSAEARELERGDTVATRPRPELDPLGVRVGGFLLFPSVAVEEYYDDNLFATKSSKIDDFLTVIRPRVAINSEWENHAFNVEGGADIGRWADHTDENYEDYHVNVDGRVDVTRDITGFAGARYAQLHEDLGSPDDVSGEEPTIYTETSAFLRYVHVLNRVSFTGDLDALKLDYDDVGATADPINNDDRDRLQTSATLRAGYEIVPEYEAFLRVQLNDRSYDDGVDDSDVDRDSYGYEAVAGVELDLGGVLFGDVFAGYAEQTYGNTNLPEIGGVTMGGSLDWNITTLTTLNGSIIRTIEESTIGTSSGFFATTASVTADHELLRNLLLNANLGMESRRTTTKGMPDSSVRTTSTGPGSAPNICSNRYFYASAGYRFVFRSADDNRAGVDPDYQNNIFLIRLEGQL